MCMFGIGITTEDAEGRPPIGVEFEIPYFTVSGIQVGHTHTNTHTRTPNTLCACAQVRLVCLLHPTVTRPSGHCFSVLLLMTALHWECPRSFCCTLDCVLCGVAVYSTNSSRVWGLHHDRLVCSHVRVVALWSAGAVLKNYREKRIPGAALGSLHHTKRGLSTSDDLKPTCIDATPTTTRAQHEHTHTHT